MDPVLNQTTTTRTTYGQTPNTRDFSNWSDRELRKELKKYGEKVPRETERSQLLSRLQFFETNQRSGSFPISQPISTQSIPISQPITTHSVVPVQKINRDFNTWSDRELRKELKKFGEKVPRETERSQLLSRLQFFETNQRSGVSTPLKTTGLPLQSQSVSNYPVQQTHSIVPIVHQGTIIDNRTFNDLSDRELRKELKKYGEKVPRETERSELLRRLDVHQKSSQLPISSPVKSTVPIIGTTHLSTQTHPVTLIQHSGISNQTIPQQTGIPQQSLPGSLVYDKDTKMYNNWSEKEMRRELKKKYGDRVPKNTQRMELIRRLNCCHNNEKNTGFSRVTGLPVQQTLPQQTVPLQQTGYPQQQNQQNIPRQYPVQQNQQIGFPQQNQQTSVPTQKNIPHQIGTNQHY